MRPNSPRLLLVILISLTFLVGAASAAASSTATLTITGKVVKPAAAVFTVTTTCGCGHTVKCDCDKDDINDKNRCDCYPDDTSDACKCKALQVKVVDQSTGGPFKSWVLDFKDGTTITTQNLLTNTYYHTYTTAGNHQVTLIVDNGGGPTLPTVQYVTVPHPCADFTFTVNTACGSIPVQFTDTSKGYKPFKSYYWDFGDNTNSGTTNPANPLHTYPAGGGPYTVTLTVTAADGTQSSTTKIVTVPPAAYAVFSVTRTCGSKTVNFIPSSCGVKTGWKYNWVFSDGKTLATTSSASFTHAYQNKGTYKVTLTVTDAAGKATNIPASSRLVSVPPPCSGFTSGTTCNSWIGKFTDGSSGDLGKWHWDFGDGQSSDVENPSHTFGTDGTFTVNLQITANDGSTDQCNHKVTVRPICAGFTTSTTCGSLIVALTDQSNPVANIQSWLWKFGDGSTLPIPPPTGATSATTTHKYTTDGTYGITLTVYGKDGSSSVTTPATNVKVCSALTPSISLPATWTATHGKTVSFKGTSTGTPSSWIWNFGDGATQSSTSATANHIYTKAGKYNVVLSVKDACGCTYPTAAKQITIT